MALLTPLLLLLILVVVALSRLVSARIDLDSAAQQAARAASLARSAAAAEQAAQDAAAGALASAGRACQAVHVVTDTSAMRPGGYARVTVSCTTTLSDLGLPLPGARTSSSQALAPIDRYRAENLGGQR